MYWSAGGLFVLVLLPICALTSTAPIFAPAGESIVHSVVEGQRTAVAACVPNSKPVVPLPTANPPPVTVTSVSPPMGPSSGLTYVTVAASYAKLCKLVAPGLVTETFVIPAVPGGVTAVIKVGELTVKLVAVAEPNMTLVTSEKPSPLIVTFVPPLLARILQEAV